MNRFLGKTNLVQLNLYYDKNKYKSIKIVQNKFKISKKSKKKLKSSQVPILF